MRFFSAQYVITNTGKPLKRPVICTGDDGLIISVKDTGVNLSEKANIEFYNGIITPGFVNCHCHLELSYLRNKITPGKGLHGFLSEITGKRFNTSEDEHEHAFKADMSMAGTGVVLCADICNSSVTFEIKKKSRIQYINLIEIFGIDSRKAGQRMNEAVMLAAEAEKHSLEWYFTPHSAYSVSLPLFRLIKEKSSHNRVTSIHFLESESEIPFLESHSGPLMTVYRRFLPPDDEPLTVNDHITAVINEITPSGNLILVHNVFTGKPHIDALKERKNLYYCICPNSNLIIEGKLPPVTLLADEGCDIVLGTDSLSSNKELNILSEMKTLGNAFPDINLETLVRWATLNGAKALSAGSFAGTIEPGKRPGLVLIKDADLINLRLLPESTSVRLI